MKRLTFIRHGKSSWNHGLPDHDRPLKQRATADASLVITAFKASMQGYGPMVWSSSAKRALETAKMFKEQLSIEESDFMVKQELYTFDSDELKAVVNLCDDRINDLVIVGHNPAITDLVNELGTIYFDNVPTTGLVCLEFETNKWTDISEGKTTYYLFPKNLR